MRTSELTGALLDYWVARAEDYQAEVRKYEMADGWHHYCNVKERTRNQVFMPSKSWDQGGRIIDREGISLKCGEDRSWYAYSEFFDATAAGGSALEAAMRAIVKNKFGAEVPDEVSDLTSA
ncbi:phage protein NinX family protein [Bradyrhizobium japonicum]|jgi:hypothetical protein|uniref:phage protein NinX family protein n=1 Tax=Bradyrhizobium japonicum TaxID=375 RepID=UPI0020A03FAF|nr:phage protein NinX family protein [Bradyrhizobium japonicum]MCP1765030.1 hypothetical protein [Bradyrhizobium japonicum]MCP1787167.1 hypothetical protein [Bradyrhizobium japonicum]MCP1809044.1 hypothetical protein [Bradyrhizobium japonicum]MCP1817974.1 hypothetical protein [Bradyrhizobium japonicum]MCP1870514.1 hypothetical protein [Bradyrhizobium japonicum]